MRAAVLGSPIAHSLSPALHNAGYAALGLDDWSYERRELGAGGLAAFLETLDGDWRGLSLTMPLKPECVEAADEVSPLAGRIGVGNTLVRLAGGGWRADNTDVFGMGEALRPGWDDSWREAAVLGAGATARTALFALRGLGVERLDVCARDEAKAARLAEAFESLGGRAQTRPLDGWRASRAQAVVSTLPAGVAVPLEWPAGARLLLDVVYDGWPTPLARSARAAGLAVVGGLEMLVAQAAKQFELFTGLAAPVDAMRLAGLRELR